jgi:hypothetical protein
MPERDECMLRDLRCEENDHPFKKRILQTVHTVPGSNEILFIGTPKGALDNAWCPVPGCGSLAEDPNE